MRRIACIGLAAIMVLLSNSALPGEKDKNLTETATASRPPFAVNKYSRGIKVVNIRRSYGVSTKEDRYIALAECREGESAIGGGFERASEEVHILSSEPAVARTAHHAFGWKVIAKYHKSIENSDKDALVFAYAVCAHS